MAESGIDALIASKCPLLLDSGAFQEVAIEDGRAVVKKSIADVEWHRRLSIYLRIAKAKGRKVTVIAPDQVGSQSGTLKRLEQFRPQILQIQSTSARIVVPIQIGTMSMIEFYQAVANVLGFRPIPAMPMKKAPQPSNEIVSFLERVSVDQVHFLGIGGQNPRLQWLVEELARRRPGLQVSTDSNRIRASLGATRAITQLEAQNRQELGSHICGEVDLREWRGGMYDMTEMLFFPSGWLQEVTAVEEFAANLTWFSEQDRAEFVRDPDEFLLTRDADDWITDALMRSYQIYVSRQVARAARCKAVAQTLRREVKQYGTGQRDRGQFNAGHCRQLAQNL